MSAGASEELWQVSYNLPVLDPTVAPKVLELLGFAPEAVISCLQLTLLPGRLPGLEVIQHVPREQAQAMNFAFKNETVVGRFSYIF